MENGLDHWKVEGGGIGIEANQSLESILRIWQVIDSQLGSLSRREPSVSSDDDLALEHNYLDTQCRLIGMASDVKSKSFDDVRRKMALWHIEASATLSGKTECRTDRLLRSVLSDLTELCVETENT